MGKPRRGFLKSAAGLAAGIAMPCRHEGEAFAAQVAVSGTLMPPATPQAMPLGKLGKYAPSRLIVGANPFYGYSHFNRLFSQHMVEWTTPERVCGVLRQCEQNGINTWQFSHNERAISDLKRHRAEGGKLNWILLSHKTTEDDPKVIPEVAKLAPVGIVHHGGSAERKRRTGKLGEVQDFLKRVRDSGVMVGLSTHDPDFLAEVESKGWDVDFYMTAIYYLTRSAEEFEKMMGRKPIGEVYLPDDPPRMFEMIRKTKRTCLAYKVLAAGRLTDSPATIDEAFRTTLEKIKPQDCIIVGMYPRFQDQVRENADRMRRFGVARA